MNASWLLLDSGLCDPALNMALDEALLNSAVSVGQPVLRFYGWTQSAASFGYFQRYANVESATRLRPLIRRPTGGGIVPHDADWTYSATIPANHEWHGLKAVQSYCRMHEWIRAAFTRMTIQTKLAEDSRKPRPGECFAGHEVSDVLWQGRKIAGAAQRRTKTGLLIQGSVQPPPVSLDRSAWQRAMVEAISAPAEPWKPDDRLLTLADELERTKYACARYNRRR